MKIVMPRVLSVTLMFLMLGSMVCGAAEGNEKRAAERTRKPTPERNRTEAQRSRTYYALNEEQRRLFQEAIREHRPRLAELGGKDREVSRQIIELTLSEAFDENELQKKLEELAKIRSEGYKIRARALSMVAPTLKPEQREQLIQRWGMEILYGRLDGRWDRGRGQRRDR